jgi:RecJ-like exonuclease
MSDEPLNPGDEAAPGTPGTGEHLCPACQGRGQLEGVECRACGGSGRIIAGIGGA